MAYIYLITNDINNKVYVGKTEHSIYKRFQEHCSESNKLRCKNRPLYRAMNKYGCEHFSISLLEETTQPEEREAYWIDEKQSYYKGYNATRGGDGKKYLDYDLIYNTYSKFQNATKTAAVLGISVDTVLAVVHQRGSVKTAQEVIKDTKSKAVQMYDLDGNLEQVFVSIKEAAKFLQNNKITPTIEVTGITKSIRLCANGRRKTAYKKLWKWV